MKKILILLTSLLVFHGSFTTTYAQDGPIAIENVPNIVGVAVGMFPDYMGSNDYKLGVAPFARYTLPNSERYFMLNVTELYFNVVNHPRIRFGPVLNYRFGRDDDVEDMYVKRMTKIDDTLEAGAFLGYEWRFGDDRRHRFITDVELLFDVGGVYNGVNGTWSARYWRPLGKMFDVVLGVAVQVADNKYVDKYFGVSAVDFLRSGLPFYQAGGGATNFRVFPGVVMHLSESWHLAGGFRYERMTGDAKDSPVVSMRGSADQWVVGLGAAFSW
jgi:outer membrane protein